jgi:hypothetical protein
MATIYVVRVQGFGDDEDAFEVTGVFSTRALAEQAVSNIEADWVDDVGEDEDMVVTEIEEYELDA